MTSLHGTNECSVGGDLIHESDEGADFAGRQEAEFGEAVVQTGNQVLLCLVVPLSWRIKDETEKNAGEEGGCHVVSGRIGDGL